MGEHLSQDELDRLFAEAADEPSAGSAGLTDDQLGRVHGLLAEGWAKLVSTMSQSLGHEVSLDYARGRVAARDDVTADVESHGVLIHFPVSAESSGPHGLILSTDLSAKLAALIAGDDPAGAVLGAEHLQGILDFMDMSLPLVADGLQAAIGQRVEFGGAVGINTTDPAADWDLADIGFDASLVCLGYTLTVGELASGPMLYVLNRTHAEELLQAAASAAAPAFAEFHAAGGGEGDSAAAGAGGGIDNINLIMDIELEVVARLGEIEMPIREILKLGPGSIIDIDRAADAPVELVVNDKLVAKGDVVVVQENFGLKITEVLSPKERIESLR